MKLTMRVTYGMSRNDPSDASTLVTSEILPGLTQDEAIKAVLQ